MSSDRPRLMQRRLVFGVIYALGGAVGLTLGAFGVLDAIGVLFWIVVFSIWFTGMSLAPRATGNITVFGVVSIILVTVALAALVRARDTARRVTTMDRLRQLQRAQHDRNRFYDGGRLRGPLTEPDFDGTRERPTPRMAPSDRESYDRKPASTDSASTDSASTDSASTNSASTNSASTNSASTDNPRE